MSNTWKKEIPEKSIQENVLDVKYSQIKSSHQVPCKINEKVRYHARYLKQSPLRREKPYLFYQRQFIIKDC